MRTNDRGRLSEEVLGSAVVWNRRPTLKLCDSGRLRRNRYAQLFIWLIRRRERGPSVVGGVVWRWLEALSETRNAALGR